MDQALAVEASRLRWLCRRGMKELDVLLERFYAREFDELDGDGRAAFRGLLELEDPDLYAVLVGGVRHPDPAQEALAARIRVHQRVV